MSESPEKVRVVGNRESHKRLDLRIVNRRTAAGKGQSRRKRRESYGESRRKRKDSPEESSEKSQDESPDMEEVAGK